MQIINIRTVYTISTETAAHSHHDKIRCACKYNAAFRAKIHAIIRSTFRATSYLWLQDEDYFADLVEELVGLYGCPDSKDKYPDGGPYTLQEYFL